MVKSHTLSLKCQKVEGVMVPCGIEMYLLMTKDGRCPSDRECNNGGERLEYNSDIYFNVIVHKNKAPVLVRSQTLNAAIWQICRCALKMLFPFVLP